MPPSFTTVSHQASYLQAIATAPRSHYMRENVSSSLKPSGTLCFCTLHIITDAHQYHFIEVHLSSSFAWWLLEVFNDATSVFKDTMSASMPCMMQIILCRISSETSFFPSPSSLPPWLREIPPEGEVVVETGLAARNRPLAEETTFGFGAFVLKAPFRATFLLLALARASAGVAWCLVFRLPAGAGSALGGCLRSVCSSEENNGELL